MSANPEQDRVARMDLPPAGGAIGVVVLALFVSFFTALAIWNLVTYSNTPLFGVVAAVLWLALVLFVSYVGIYESSVRELVIACLGEFSLCHFVEAVREDERIVIVFGYELFRRRFYYLRVERSHIVSVDMQTGQATALAHRDMNDWHVTLWYRDPSAAPRKPIAGLREEELYIVGPHRAKAWITEFFGQFVAFLRSAGVELNPTEKENELRATGSASAPLNPPSTPSPSA